MVDFHELSTARFDVLENAATAWTTAAQKLKSMDDDWNTTVVGKIFSVCWAGPAADQARPGLKRTNEQLTAAVTEANALASLFKDAATEFQAARSKLEKAVADAVAAGLTVGPDGTVSWPPADQATRHDPDGYRDYQNEYRGKAETARNAIDAAVQEATAADERIAYALRSDTSTDPQKSFNARAIGGGPEADGRRAALLAARGGDIGDAELTELNSLLAAHSGDPKFAVAFYQDLGPDGLIKSWNSMVGDPAHYRDPNDPRWKAYQELQKNLGLNLATATRTGNEPHLSDEWAAALRKAGSQPVWDKPMRPTGLDYVPYGYQVLSGILATGDYDPHFLGPIAEHVTQLDTRDDKYWPAPPPSVADRVHGFNLLGGPEAGSGFRPTTAILEALGHSPEAANAFFTGQATAYHEDGTVDPGGRPKPADYFDYYVHDKEWIPDTGSRDPDLAAKTRLGGPAALGHALEAATTGHPYDGPAAVPPTPHTAQQAGLMQRVVDTFGTHGDHGALDEIKGDGSLAPMRTSLGHMTAEYIGDVQNALSHTTDLPVNGSPASLRDAPVSGLLDALGRDPDAYGAVTNANQAYTTAVIRGHMDAGQTDFARLQADIDHASRAGGVVNGVLNEARVDEVHNQHAASDKEYNDALETNVGYAKDAFNSTIGSVTEKIPLGGEISGAIVDSIADSVIEANSRDTTEDGRQEARNFNDDAKNGAATGAQQAVRDAAVGSGLGYDDVRRLADSAGDRALDGYTTGVADGLSANAKGSS
ncbi:hypothetical protein ACIRS1_32670 [Kitasatospora sp. NPDC101176]|uniref:hypothetical protein n=1 Tax=Kitasatospora sp. NPDC101176 TaxID=3364099 RepID=UPI0038028E3A